MKRLLTAVIAVAMSFSVARAEQAGSAANRFVQDRFAIGIWWGPPNENLEARYQELADANFNFLIGGQGTPAAEQIKLCERFGLKVLTEDSGPVEKWADGPACWGYHLMDEPGGGQFADLAPKVEAIRKTHPGKFGYINLLPNYAPESWLGSKYEEYIAKFIREVKPDVLSMDHYPLMRPEGDSRQDYCDNLEIMRKHANGADIPFWNFFYSMPFNDRLDPTEAQIRWQIFAAVAHGAKGVMYFCYWTPGKGAAGAGEFPKGGAIITAEGLKTRHYDEARRINAELKNLGPTLMQLTCSGATRIKTGNEPTEMPAGHGVRTMAKVAGDPDGEFIIGSFTHADGRRAMLILNHNYCYTAWPTVQFDADIQDVQEVSKTTGKISAVVDDSPELKGTQLSFGAGDGRLFLLPPAK